MKYQWHFICEDYVQMLCNDILGVYMYTRANFWLSRKRSTIKWTVFNSMTRFPITFRVRVKERERERKETIYKRTLIHICNYVQNSHIRLRFIRRSFLICFSSSTLISCSLRTMFFVGCMKNTFLIVFTTSAAVGSSSICKNI